MCDDFDDMYDDIEDYWYDYDEEHCNCKYDKNSDKNKRNDNSGCCYIATCVYGSYDCPEVWTLRRFRDYTLAKTWHGRVFIHTYYALAPTLVKLFSDTKWFKSVWKLLLDRKIKKLNDEGVINTPYQDKKW